jgi:hypothetical protein
MAHRRIDVIYLFYHQIPHWTPAVHSSGQCNAMQCNAHILRENYEIKAYLRSKVFGHEHQFLVNRLLTNNSSFSASLTLVDSTITNPLTNQW